tara:strand:+ start:84 stop:683 length:600 start_codon:yes stop_codon:yes gene_type:complete
MTPKKLTPKQLEKELRVLKEDIQMSQTGLENCKSEEDRESYIRLEKGYQKQLDDLIKNNPPKIKKVKVVYWTPESKGEIDKSFFEGKPYLTVNVKDSYTKRPTYESIRKSWYRVSTERCENLVEEKGYIVGVIKNVVVGVVQVSGWKRLEIREGENQGRVEFTGELLSDHLTIDYTLTDITVSGTLQGFNFPYQEEKES